MNPMTTGPILGLALFTANNAITTQPPVTPASCAGVPDVWLILLLGFVIGLACTAWKPRKGNNHEN